MKDRANHRDENRQMTVRGALSPLIAARTSSAVVVTNQGSARVWPLLESHPLDFHYNPSTMGGAVPFALGLALAQPEKEVICITGDGALAMSLGSLVTVAASAASNVSVIVLDNGIYEVTGGQTTAAAIAQVDYVNLALSVGFATALQFDHETEWSSNVDEALRATGPRLISLNIEPAQPEDMATKNEPINSQLDRLRRELTKTKP